MTEPKKTFEDFLQENFKDDITEYNINVRVIECDNKKQMIATAILPIDSPFEETLTPIAVRGNRVLFVADVVGDEVKVKE